ncbi:hypothetical protein [Cellvibrio sp. QJXJ]|uniref:hypothetical protein n=1 Tax=Cellvibrio sp. QJXJ TaxID=2964606 RepID=UPI0021C42F66|nr:hypothetical protein [Cellvibrio sp. QJXJ]UUA75187.1 hypothetical protein NNX04_22275 [Cellvibrio sp. QJXJ]
MDAVTLLVQVSSNYPYIAYLIKLLSILIGTGALIYALWIEIQINVFQSTHYSNAGGFKTFIICLFAGFLISLGVTLNIVGATFYDYGDFIIQEYGNSDSWKVDESSVNTIAMKQFVIVSSKVLALIFGFWGALGILLTAFPQAETKFWPGFVRVVVGAAMFNPIAILDFFGGWGTKFLAP